MGAQNFFLSDDEEGIYLSADKVKCLKCFMCTTVTLLFLVLFLVTALMVVMIRAHM